MDGSKYLYRHIGEDFVAALEAASGKPEFPYYGSKMDGRQVLEGLSRILMTSFPARALSVLARTGVLAEILPEVDALVGFGEGVRHKNVWEHTMMVVDQTPGRLNLRFAALFHDIGKVPTRRFAADGKITFTGHPEVGARMFDRIAKRFPFPPHAVAHIRFLISAHLRASAYDASWTDSAVRRFYKDCGKYLNDLIDLTRADITSRYEDKIRKGFEQLDALVLRINELVTEDSKPKALPKGLGNALISRFNIVPGPGLGRLMKQLQDCVESGKISALADFEYYLSYVENTAQLFNIIKKD
jgi:poly(A) polymerase